MRPVVALVGRPNVGKSTLFNCLTKSRNALVYDEPGVTRDRIYQVCSYQDKEIMLVDTGGLSDAKNNIEELMTQQSWNAIEEADVVVFMVDARAGLTVGDEEIVQRLRTMNKNCIIAVNKTDGLNAEVAVTEFFKVGLTNNIVPIAASHNKGTQKLLATVIDAIPPEKFIKDENLEDTDETVIRFAVIGRPNVGKSTLVNRILGEERVIAFDAPGTTRDSIALPFTRRDQKYLVIDTAGIRRKARIKESLEKFSVIKTLQAIDNCNVVVYLLDAREGIIDQDLHILGLISKSGKGLIIAVNKCDGLDEYQKDKIRTELNYKIPFVDYALIQRISAKFGTGVGELFPKLEEVHKACFTDVSTHKLTDILHQAIETHEPPLVNGRRIKLRFAHMGGKNPPRIVIHGNQIPKLPEHYKRYLAKFFRQKLNIVGAPIRIELKQNANPYADRKD